MRKSSVNWLRTPLSNVLKERTEIPNPSDLELGLIPIVSKIGFDTGKIELRQVRKTRTKMILIRPGDLVLSGINAAKGAIAICEEKIPISATIHYSSYKPNPEKIDILFLWYFLRSEVFRDILRDNVPGGIKTELKPKRFLPIRVPLPSLEEQRRIVARIEQLTSRIEKAKALRRQAQEQVNGMLPAVLDALFSGRNIERWKRDKIAGFCEKPRYGYTESAKWDPVGPKFLRITDIQNGKVDWDLVPYCECSEIEKYGLMPGDILFARTGATTGKSFLVQTSPEAVFASYLIRLRVKDRVTPEYLYWFFQSPRYWNQVLEKKGGSAQPNMNGRKLANVEVVFPPPEEQHRIIAYLNKLQSQVDELREYQVETQKQLDALTQSILSKAFKGEL